MEELRQELNRVVEIAGNITGVHKRVSEQMGWSVQYLYMIIEGRRLTKDKADNRNKLTELIGLYNDEIRLFNAKQIEVVL